MPALMTSDDPLLEIDADEGVHSVIFTANGEHLVSSGVKGVRVWRAEDGKQVAAMKVKSGGIASVSVSQDCRWIAAGSWNDLFVWDATTYKQVFAQKSKSSIIASIDFSPDSSRLVSADRRHGTATIWDIVANRKIRTLSHNSGKHWTLVAKYSPRGDRIATATEESIRIWDSDDGCLLLDVKVPVKELHDLVWSENCLLIQTSHGTIKQISAATGLTVLEWPVSHTNGTSCIALPQHGKFIAYSAKKTITFWDTATHSQLSLISHAHDIRSIACSPDGQLLAIAAEGRIVVKFLSSLVSPSPVRFVPCLNPSSPHLQLHIPGFYLYSVVLGAPKRGQLVRADALSSTAIPTSKGTAYHVLASWALVWARLGQLDAALVDTNEHLKVQRFVIDFIA